MIIDRTESADSIALLFDIANVVARSAHFGRLVKGAVGQITTGAKSALPLCTGQLAGGRITAFVRLVGLICCVEKEASKFATVTQFVALQYAVTADRLVEEVRPKLSLGSRQIEIEFV